MAQRRAWLNILFLGLVPTLTFDKIPEDLAGLFKPYNDVRLRRGWGEGARGEGYLGGGGSGRSSLYTSSAASCLTFSTPNVLS